MSYLEGLRPIRTPILVVGLSMGLLHAMETGNWAAVLFWPAVILGVALGVCVCISSEMEGGA